MAVGVELGLGSKTSRPPFAKRTPAAESHKLVLFDIDGTLVSAGRVARDSILRALESAYVWKAGEEHEDRSRYDFSGKTDPQIVRDLVIDRVGAERCESDLPRALDLYLEELERQLPAGPARPTAGGA